MSSINSAGPQTITVGDPEPIDVQLVDLTARHSRRRDPHSDVVKVWLHLECGHGAGGSDPHLIPINRHWSPPEPISEDGRCRWAQVYAIAKDLFGVRPRPVAEVELVTDELAMVTYWAVSEKPAPGCRRAVLVRGEWRNER